MDMIFGTIDGGFRRRMHTVFATAAMAIALLAVVLGPQMASAAAMRTISLTSYQSGQKCYVKEGESICEKRYDGFYNLLQVNGKHFSAYGPVIIKASALGLPISETGSVQADANGNFVYRSPQIEICITGVPLTVKAYDALTGTWSSYATIFACAS